MMLFLIPTAAVLLAAILLVPVLKSGSTPKSRRRVIANAGVFLTAAVLLVTLSVGVSAAADPATATAAALMGRDCVPHVKAYVKSMKDAVRSAN